MNDVINKTKEHLVEQKKMYLVLCIALMIAIIVGISYLFFINGESKLFLNGEIKHFFDSMKNLDNLNYNSNFISSIITNLFYVLGIWLLGISIIGLPIIFLLFLFKGFVFGFSIASVISVYGFKGILGSLVYIFPHQLILLVISLLLTFYAMSFSIKLFRSLFMKKGINIREGMQKYIKILILSIVFSIFASAIEIYISPFLIQLFTRMI